MNLLTKYFFLISFLAYSMEVYAFEATDKLVQSAISEKTLPGGVLLVGQYDKVLHQKNYNSSFDTLYDLASLTKVSTAISILVLEERHKLKVSDPLSKYYSEFKTKEKKHITIEHLLRHNSGLPAVVRAEKGESYQNFMEKTLSLPLEYKTGEKTVYSDVGFIILGDLVQKVSGMSLSEFTENNIFKPLEMNDTRYGVLNKDRSRCAPTSEVIRCIPHDPKALNMYPHSLGHAGVFSTVQDLSHLAQMFLFKGIYKNKRILKEVSVRKMSMVSTGELRGMGFDLQSPYAVPPRGEVFPAGISYGHTGFTGTTFWIDPQSMSYYIFLSNRVFLGETITGKPFTELRKKLSTSIGKRIYKDFNLAKNKAASETQSTEVETK